jgi:solute carrier family 25 (mitochondrial carnitine/acylcarnitine transporter), member 20/29
MLVASNFSQQTQQVFVNGVSGMIAGASGIFVGHPFDTMKIRLQVGDLSQKASIGAKSLRELYRGLIPPLCTAGFTQFMVFGIYEHVKAKCLVDYQHFGFNNLNSTFVAATVAGAISSYVTSPVQLIKVQQQSARTATSLTLRQCLHNVVREHGWRGLFHGSVSVFFVEGVGRGIYMLSYEQLKDTLSGGQAEKLTVPVKVVSAGLSGAFSWFVMYPLDSIKSRRLHDLHSTSSYQCFQHIWRVGGVPAFYRGCAFAMLRSMPVAGTILPLYEWFRDGLSAQLVNQ